jgi:DNA modification methylase
MTTSGVASGRKSSKFVAERNLNSYLVMAIANIVPNIVDTAVSNQNIKNFSKKEHPAPFPKDIVILPILQTSQVGDKVLDPFCGTGTVGRICLELSRSFVGYDII